MIKKYFYLVLLAGVNVYAQTAQMTLTTSKTVGENIQLRIDAEEDEKPNVWIDLNNNGTKDNGEQVTTFLSESSYLLEAQTITIHGEVTYLSCDSAELTSMDTSSNTALQYLYCDKNELTSLDVSNNTSLKKLYCHQNNLTSLTLNGSALTLLNCRKNLIRDLDLSQATSLEKLYCYDNKLTSLDLSNNHVLKRVHCQNNQLTSLNIANGNNAGLLGFGSVAAFNAQNNPQLSCIKIDEGFTPGATWKKDAQTSWNSACALGVQDEIISSETITIAPNPVKDVLKIHTPLSIREVIVYNAQGQIVHHFEGKQSNIAFLTSGVYYLKITTDKGIHYTKIMKK